MRVLFLDIDGVLNVHEPLDAEVMCGKLHADKVNRLNFVLRKTGAMIVVSSAWRYFIHRGEMNLAGFDWLLRSHGVIAGRLAGVTRPDTMKIRGDVYNGDPKTWPMTNERGQQIQDWINISVGMTGFAVSGYAVVDDLDLGIREAGHPFVQTDGKVGLTIANCAQLVNMLRATR